ncbi:MAG TPA: hypothetical protein DDZ80_12675 [Cyanobacteria bacterium UBA8803]|nr:hypothetical protein [Cyanobacteria bacterium UBA9273]HBL59330.1 hypothetical protein [Cyanobacteria bacterium UBA8803]
MKIGTQFFASTLLAPIAIGVGLSTVALGITFGLLSQPATAQSAETVKPLEDLNSRQNERDPLTGRTGSGGLSVFDIIHRSRLGVDVEGFTSELDENLDKATQEFRRQQLEQLRNPQQVPPTNSGEN